MDERKERPRIQKEWVQKEYKPQQRDFRKKPNLTFKDKPKKKFFAPKLEPSKLVENGKRYRAIYPEYMGFDKDTRLIFLETTKGYRADVGGGLWIGYPAKIIENNDATFMQL